MKNDIVYVLMANDTAIEVYLDKAKAHKEKRKMNREDEKRITKTRKYGSRIFYHINECKLIL